MSRTLAIWDTSAPREPEFERRWRERIEDSPHANFSLSLDFLSWEASRGQRAVAVLAEDGARAGGVVLRDAGKEWVSGWPWRWQALMADRSRPTPGIGANDAGWLFERACDAADDGRRVRCFLPQPPPAGTPGFAAGATIFQSLEHSDSELLSSMGNSKRRMIRKAESSGYQVVEAGDPATFEAFHRLQIAARARRGPVEPASAGAEDWREWELPWMWLLVAQKRGEVHSGVGDGVMRGGCVDGRTAASSLEARREGAFALLCFEEARRARDRGHRWLNHCGDTTWKREVAGRLGTRFPMWCWLSGGRWALPNTAETTWMSFRPIAARWLKRWRGEGG